MTGPPRELRQFLYRYDPGIESLALGLREVVHEETAPCREHVVGMRSKVVLRYGVTAGVVSGGICNIGVFARHVTLGFPRGTELDDPAGGLQGTGKAVRHIALKKLSDLARPEIRAYLRQARAIAPALSRPPSRIRPNRSAAAGV